MELRVSTPVGVRLTVDIQGGPYRFLMSSSYILNLVMDLLSRITVHRALTVLLLHENQHVGLLLRVYQFVDAPHHNWL